MKEIRKVTISGIDYQFGHISVRKLNKLWIRIVKLAGASLGAAMEGAAGSGKVDFVKIMREVSLAVDEELLDKLFLEILVSTSKLDGVIGNITNKNFDVAFDSLGDLYKVVYEALDYYYADFLKEALSSLKDKGLLSQVQQVAAQ